MFLTLITKYRGLFTKKRKLINVHPLGARTSVQITLPFKSFKYKFASLNSRLNERASANLISKFIYRVIHPNFYKIGIFRSKTVNVSTVYVTDLRWIPQYKL